MYAVCSFLTARVAEIGWLAAFARVWVWVAVAVWLAVVLELIFRKRHPHARHRRG